MPRFFFNVYDGISLPDHEGTLLANWQEARLEAIQLAAGLIRDGNSLRALGEDWTIEVLDERGLILFRLDFHITEAPAITGALGGASEH